MSGINLEGVDIGDDVYIGVDVYNDGQFLTVSAGGADYDSTGTVRLDRDRAEQLQSWLSQALVKWDDDV